MLYIAEYCISKKEYQIVTIKEIINRNVPIIVDSTDKENDFLMIGASYNLDLLVNYVEGVADKVNVLKEDLRVINGYSKNNRS